MNTVFKDPPSLPVQLKYFLGALKGSSSEQQRTWNNRGKPFLFLLNLSDLNGRHFCFLRSHKKTPRGWSQAGRKLQDRAFSIKPVSLRCQPRSHRLGSLPKETQTETEPWSSGRRTVCVWSTRSKPGWLCARGRRAAGHLHVPFPAAALMAGLQNRGARVLETEWKVRKPPLLCAFTWPYCIQKLAYCSVLKSQLFQWKKKKFHMLVIYFYNLALIAAYFSLWKDKLEAVFIVFV